MNIEAENGNHKNTLILFWKLVNTVQLHDFN